MAELLRKWFEHRTVSRNFRYCIRSWDWLSCWHGAGIFARLPIFSIFRFSDFRVDSSFRVRANIFGYCAIFMLDMCDVECVVACHICIVLCVSIEVLNVIPSLAMSGTTMEATSKRGTSHEVVVVVVVDGAISAMVP